MATGGPTHTMLMIFCILMCSESVLCKDIYIKASLNDHCRGSPCLTLSQFSLIAEFCRRHGSVLYKDILNDHYLGSLCLNLSNSLIANYFTNDMTLIFEAGNHSLELELQITHKTSFSMFGNTTSFSKHSVIIACNKHGRFMFSGVHKVYMTGLNYVNCLGNKLKSVDQFIIEGSKFKGRKWKQYNNSDGSLINIFGHTSAHFIRTSFEENEFGKSIVSEALLNERQLGYHIRLLDFNVGGAIYAEESKIELVECLFDKNKADFGGAIFIWRNSEITVTRTSFIRNIASYFALDSNIIIFSSAIIMSEGGGGAILADNSSLFIANSSFKHNKGSNGGAVRWIASEGKATIIGSTFTDNVAHDTGGVLKWTGAIYGGVSLNSIQGSLTIVMNYNNFESNHASKQGGVLSLDGYTLKSTDIILNDNLFKDNHALNDGGVIEIRDTNVKIIGSNFTANRANGNGGILFTVGSNITITQSSFQFNTAGKDGGVIASELSNISIFECNFTSNSVDQNGHAGVIKAEQISLSLVNASLINNSADFGGVLWTQLAEIEVYNVIVVGNLAHTDGGVFHTERSQMGIVGTKFIDNRADNNGGIMQADRDRISMVDCEFNRSIAGNDGGVIRAYLSEMNVSECVFISNTAENNGGVYDIEQSNLTICNQTYFMDNTAETGGVIWNDAGILRIIDQASFTNNMATTGGVIWTDAGTVKIDTASFTDNKATTGAVMWIDRATISGNGIKAHNNYASYTTIYSLESIIEFTDSLLSSNVGSLCAIESTVRLTDTVMTKMQTAGNQSNANQLEEGGAITAFQSDITFDGNNSLMHHRASKGGALLATEAKLYLNGTVTIANNTASQDGGGIYLYQSELTCQRKSALKLLGNTAREKGGGIYAAGSLIKVKIPVAKSHALKHSMLKIVSNKADKGGGIFHEMDSKVSILKSTASNFTKKYEAINFTANEANYGGAVYVSDDGMCALSASDNKQCSFQVQALYGSIPSVNFDNSCKNIYFKKNMARVLGHSLYGGLLDRCKVSPLAEMLLNNASVGHILSNRTVTVGGLAYFHSISNVKNSDIASLPVRVCFCRNGQPDCSYNPDPVPIRRGQLTEFPLSLATLDQINRPIEATIYNRLSSGDDLCQHHIQTNDGNCSIINFTASLNLNESQSEELIMLPSGPCKEIPNSQVRVTFNVYCPKCPVGFELVKDEEGCRCQCDNSLLPFISNCRLSSNTLVRDRNIWIAYINTTDDSEGYQYLKHPYCPLDYCHPSSSLVELNLNLPNGSDAQCANGRTGLLCGTCQPGLSLSLGSSHCIRCPPHWPANLVAIVIASLLAGILLVVFILLLNLTVAVGTLNAIIFYANILAAGNSIFLQTSASNFATVFISWLNLEIGFNACFFEGMDAFWKTMLQLAFPAYIISLVIVVIFISEYSNRFSNLIGKRNPVATLATLILLSYTKLLNTVITSLSFAVLNYPEGSQRTVWLADASIDYLRGKHVVLFIIAGIILVAGVLYTALLLFWQCLLRHQDFFPLRWTKYPKLCHFIEPYHAPYASKHRYWTGLLLLSRVLLYIVSTINTIGDPRLTIVTISLIIACLLLIKGVLANKVYKNRLIDISETIVHFNLIVLAALTWYNLDANKSQNAVAYISITIIFALLLAVIAVHVYQYTNLSTTIKSTWLFKETLAVMHTANEAKKQAEELDNSKSKVSALESTQNQEEPTYSVVEVHNPQAYRGDCI